MITDTSPCPIYFGPELDHSSWLTHENGNRRLDFDPLVYPLASGGWAYQERALSKRNIHFTQQKIIWECMEKSQCECGFYMKLKVKNDFLDLPWEEEIITTYSRMNLSEPADRLPAIAGIAKAYAKRHTLTYLAGLWKETIAHNLLWQNSERNPGPRIRPLVAPTWSWASSRGRTSPLHFSSDTMHIQVISYKYEPVAGGDRYSRLITARLHIAGTVAFGAITNCRDGVVQMKFEDKTVCVGMDYDISAAGEDYIEFGTVLPFLLLCDDSGRAVGAVLRCRNKERKEYERIGVSSHVKFDPFEFTTFHWVLRQATTMELILI
ncbi:uncharacterized protein F4822DRAFT_325123 [Hypoxylon trugodes]|uniref:uncharacterized protein n=1 Tax=Hypoxylon trugodes TaxID=326681 RepID=UPI0021976F61|nr:uncharacterized protein F4822DRAFT_325123 [Hypoxylon trugodes]KAI1386719.1 hypothetical protein F4822DRAFT_325123 [Hypoxylon trugodes]